jgi:NitT/TauT family transport system ATP-binding protein
MSSLLRLSQVGHSYGEVAVASELELEVGPGEFVAVVGPSGCGKTTLLNLCSGWLLPTRGTVHRQGRVRMVFQQDGLFPWLTVAENVALGLREVPSAAERAQRTAELVRWAGLSGAEDRYPHQLSGGMRQRAEIARALAGDTDLLLMDEPFSSLDWLTRLKLRADLVRLLEGGLQREAPAVMLVTHDLEEAAQLADRVVVLSERPARVLGVLSLSSPRPRDPAHPEVTAAVHQILGLLGQLGGHP